MIWEALAQVFAMGEIVSNFIWNLVLEVHAYGILPSTAQGH